MAEVRRYLEAQRTAAGPTTPSPQFSLQGAFIARLAEITARSGGVEPNSKFGPPGVYAKRIIRKLIGWYSRPVHEFDRTMIEALQQVRHDMMGLQQQIAALDRNLSQASTAAREVPPGASRDELHLRMLELFGNLLAVDAVRQILRERNPDLLRRTEQLLDLVRREPGSMQRPPAATPAKPNP